MKWNIKNSESRKCTANQVVQRDAPDMVSMAAKGNIVCCVFMTNLPPIHSMIRPQSRVHPLLRATALQSRALSAWNATLPVECNSLIRDYWLETVDSTL